jgi:hypothetical protein
VITTTVRIQKRLFIGLILASLLLISILAYGIWTISFSGLALISAWLPVIFGVAIGLLILLAAIGIAGIVLAIWGVKTLPLFQNLAWSAVNLLFPTAIRIGRFFDVDKERIEQSFIEVSNHLVKQKQITVPPERLLILTPHCIQNDECPYKVTRDTANCKRCGKCQVDELISLAETYGVKVAIVTGGTLARKAIKGMRPKAVLAIACERDLTSGIQDVFPLPVIGVLNERPCGPCCNTRVDMERVKQAVEGFLKAGNRE